MPTDNVHRSPLVGAAAVAFAVATLSAVAVVAAVDLFDLSWAGVQEIISNVGDAFRAASLVLVAGVAVTVGPVLVADRRGGRERPLAHVAGVCVTVAVVLWAAVAIAAARRDTPGERERRQDWERFRADAVGGNGR
ncbi:hypothetical protein [Limnoglobus roseus]|uniref:Uncharacterized protein n=1 Tax=Limnoglobus roseus TaxID=2598579 RepID=A0A5C1AM89_9BACT|nr:hypothetical protein [Limnoglobus roseus]QEL20529.1 hypothetical protein PX52LOC_07634 [Limnoglobus roseus]